MSAYYNELDPFAAAWLRELIKAGHIAEGEVDERSIEDILPSELAGFTQCHFFAGIGVWSHALRKAGWADDRPVWTGSCPCQPFSTAGKGAGFADERHLWPAWFHLIEQCKPAILFGEQVASKDADTWIDLVHTDMEALGYAFGAIPFPSSSVGAPHIRDRLYWVADSAGNRLRGGKTGAIETGSTARWNAERPGANECGEFPTGFEGPGSELFGGGVANMHGDGRESRGVVRSICEEPDPEYGGATCGMADNPQERLQGGIPRGSNSERGDQHGHAGCSSATCGVDHTELSSESRLRFIGGKIVREQEAKGFTGTSMVDGLEVGGSNPGLLQKYATTQPLSGVANAASRGRQSEPNTECPRVFFELDGPRSAGKQSSDKRTGSDQPRQTGPTNGFWRDADWLSCRDGRWRPVEPGTFPLAHGVAARVGRLRGYGNAINAEAATAFIESYLER